MVTMTAGSPDAFRARRIPGSSGLSGEPGRVLVTGATDGLGRYLTRELAGQGWDVIAHGRDPRRLATLSEELGVNTVQADLSSLRAVAALGDRLREQLPALHVLVNNAAVGFGAPNAGREVSADGIELRFAVNYLAGYLLTERLLPLLRNSAPARIVHVASVGQEPVDPRDDDPLSERSYDGLTAYRRSKLAQVMHTFDLAERLSETGVTANALHPATLMNTTMVAEAGIAARSSLQEGGRATLRLIVDPELGGVTGRYFDGTEQAAAHPQAYDRDSRRRLREFSDDLLAKAGLSTAPGSSGD